ncbi:MULTISPECIES: plasmid mobilization protein [unclassified Burkholderia]|uniref:plasmid mobilization protein n=1 Tax=unclassified Burkholderia TaxID=2613784 RepID=UPI000F58DF59|nr:MULTISPECIES: mobilization protein [unclassified Burkholderia]RQR38979.1 mobilization protein [Burkholderia sp. Bp9131]RQR69156.1 mobilization protein [Burkholderia sp. Bp9015]
MTHGTENRQRTIVVGVRVTGDEHVALLQKANDCGLTLAAYFRACAFGRKTRNVATSRVLDALTVLGNEQRRIGGLIKHLRGEEYLSAHERATLIGQIETAQRAVIDAIRRVDHAG